MSLTAAERRLSIVLRVLAGLMLLAALVYALGPLVGPARDFFREPPFVSNSVVKVTLIGLASLYAAGDVRRRRPLAWMVIAAHVVSLAAMASMLAFADTGRAVAIGDANPALSTVLWGAIALDGVITLALLAFVVAARPPASPAPTAVAPIAAERRLRVLMIALAALFALAAVAYDAGPFLDSSDTFFRELPFVTNSVVKVALLAMLCGYVAADVRGNLALATPVVAVHLVSVIVSALYLIFLDTGYSRPLLGADPSMTTVLWGAIALDGVLAALVWLAVRATWRARQGSRFFNPAEHRGLSAVAEVVVAG